MTQPVLFVSHPPALCGVYEFGRAIANELASSTKYDVRFVECDSASDLHEAINAHQPAAVIYNHHASSMPWLSRGVLFRHPIPHIGIFHEVTQEKADKARTDLFDFLIGPDPTLLLRNPIVFKTGRLIPHYAKSPSPPAVPTIGSFGFGTPGKGFETLVARVQDEFAEARIRLRIPYSSFIDADGASARAIADRCRRLVTRPGIQLEISHDYLSNDDILDFLASNSLNAFLYDPQPGRGISSSIDYALAVRRPVAITRTSMFRHISGTSPSITVENAGLNDILARGFAPLERYVREWTAENLVWEYERLLDQVLKRAPARLVFPPRSWTTSDNPTLRRASAMLDTATESLVGAAIPLIGRIEKQIEDPHGRAHFLKKVRGQRFFHKFYALGGRVDGAPASNGTADWVPRDGVNHLGIVDQGARARHPYCPIESPRGLNRILDNAARELYAPAVAYLFSEVPEMMSRKIPEANIQQAFVMDTVIRLAATYPSPALLAVGSYEDTASAAVQLNGLPVEEVDPVINYDLTTYLQKPTTRPGRFQVVFSTSVIEHVADDERFVREIATLLAPGGVAVLTCDFNDQYQPGDRIPVEDHRFYTQKDLRDRLLAQIPDCVPYDPPDWACENPDFSYGGCQYTFASLVFKKVR